MSSLKSKIESVLFITNHPLAVKRLAELTKADTAAVQQALKDLAADYQQAERGIMLQRTGDKIQLVTIGDNSKLVRDFIKAETTGDLSRAALETLTIIAYRGPVSRATLEQIRGVNCAIILRNLLIRGLIESTDDKKKMAITYGVTFDFLQYLGLHEQSELPDYQKLHASEQLERLINQQPAQS